MDRYVYELISNLRNELVDATEFMENIAEYVGEVELKRIEDKYALIDTVDSFLDDLEICDKCGKLLSKRDCEDFFVEDEDGEHVYCEEHYEEWRGGVVADVRDGK